MLFFVECLDITIFTPYMYRILIFNQYVNQWIYISVVRAVMKNTHHTIHHNFPHWTILEESLSTFNTSNILDVKLSFYFAQPDNHTSSTFRNRYNLALYQDSGLFTHIWYYQCLTLIWSVKMDNAILIRLTD